MLVTERHLPESAPISGCDPAGVDSPGNAPNQNDRDYSVFQTAVKDGWAEAATNIRNPELVEASKPPTRMMKLDPAMGPVIVWSAVARSCAAC